ncbi:aldose 1-epimerase family protein [Enterococcus dongliensis]|uniref:aldose 1-epimerase family protein n=1 Tax=Enterococcus dongliensis TaxID=2559925 RepID=UPI00288C9122|nr:aldose 1-epimerase family protein [Enterococcus dongliensis]MDT2604290.1 aldose 1-epimerase family protein [Enterococcus dongliensis]MDT2645516.1 aldose 1-epimerase family protein [Enterococcus dongliensis]MDT2672219.1 aldose 1-epimerase family protein [Enterococcus dongliensis]
MSVTISNDFLEATINEQGAELASLRANEIEYIWQADPKYWGRHAPLLFPFVGRLKDDQYTYQGKTYSMGQHGFARDKLFSVVEQTKDKVTFLLESDEETKAVYPFDFVLTVSYEIWGEGVRIRFNVENTGTEEMIFALGGHPAFNIPLTEELKFEDYFIAFSPQKSRVKIPLEGPFTNLDQKTIGQTNTNIQLSRDLFKEDALIYETRGLNAYTLGSEESSHRVRVAYNNVPYVGLWSPYPAEAPFVCIEPWWGFADTIDSTGRLEDKEGMNRLAANEQFKTEFSITVS